MKFAIAGCLLLILLVGNVRADDVLPESVALLEREQMRRLAAAQAKAGSEIDEFRSDGCSGGLSAAWQFLAETSPDFKRTAGDLPPWEHCCVAHDRHYWRGATDRGFEARLAADRELRACVLRTGVTEQQRLAQLLGLSPAEVLEAFDVVGEMMFRAVRLGGGPCTGLPWRWGHGWPECAPDLDMLTEDPPAEIEALLPAD